MEETSNLIQKNQYSLSIRFSSDGFSLLVYDKTGFVFSTKTISRPLFLMDKNDIVNLIEKEAAGLLEYETIRLICESDDYVFVPSQLFEIGNERDFLLLEHQIKKTDAVLCNKIANWETENVFSIPTNLKEALSQLFENVKIEHHLSYFLIDKIKKQNETILHIWVRSKIMDVALIINGNIHLINSFTYNTPEDFTFYTLNIFDQLSLDTETCKVKLFNVESNYELQTLIQKYVKQVEVNR